MPDTPPYELQALLDAVVSETHDAAGNQIRIRCAQAQGTDFYVGFSNGELMRFAIQTNISSAPGSYSLLSRQTLPSNKSIEEIVLIPSISRALILSERQIFFYTLPTLDHVQIPPVRNVVTFAVDEQHLRRGPTRPNHHIDPVELCVLKRTSISLYSLREILVFIKDIPLPSRSTLARRSGQHLCVADQQYYNMIDLQAASLFQLLPLCQAPESAPVKPFILVIGDNEFLILSWTGTSTLGLFVTGEGDPVRGTLEWPNHPKAVAFDNPHVMSLMPDDSIEIHSIETQTLVQTVPPPMHPIGLPPDMILDRVALLFTFGGVAVPSTQRTSKLRATPVSLLRKKAPPLADSVKREEEPSIEEIIDDL